jgi:hypothetical protein
MTNPFSTPDTSDVTEIPTVADASDVTGAATASDPTDSPAGRRVLVAVATGPAGDAIQAWRQRHDPVQARRLPPHATLCYWAPDTHDAAALEAQILHAFAQPISVRLGGLHEFTNRDGTFFVAVHQSDELDAARDRLYDGTHLTLPGDPTFTWHITCVRYPDDAHRDELRAAARDLDAAIAVHPVWTIDTIAWLQLRDGIYQPITTWTIETAPPALSRSPSSRAQCSREISILTPSPPREEPPC